jgi:hypothetical protein
MEMIKLPKLTPLDTGFSMLDNGCVVGLRLRGSLRHAFIVDRPASVFAALRRDGFDKLTTGKSIFNFQSSWLVARKKTSLYK